MPQSPEIRRCGLTLREERIPRPVVGTLGWLLFVLLIAPAHAETESSSEDSRQPPSQPVAQQKPTATVTIDDLSISIVPILRQLPGVVEVRCQGPLGQPANRIVHIADWHFVERDDFAADLRSQLDMSLSDKEIDRRYQEFLDEVELVQEQQLVLLRCLIRDYGLNRIYVEGLTEENRFIFDAKLSALRKLETQLTDLRELQEELLADGVPDEETRRLMDGSKEIKQRYRRDLLQLGAAGRLLLTGEIAAVLALEDAEAYAAANPLGNDGTVTFDQEKIELRQDAQVNRLLDGGPFALILLGGGHDLADNVERLSDGKAAYIRVDLEVPSELAAQTE